MAIDLGNPRRFHWSAKWTKAMEGFVHGQLAAGGAFPCHLERRSGRLRLASRPT